MPRMQAELIWNSILGGRIAATGLRQHSERPRQYHVLTQMQVDGATVAWLLAGGVAVLAAVAGLAVTPLRFQAAAA